MSGTGRPRRSRNESGPSGLSDQRPLPPIGWRERPTGKKQGSRSRSGKLDGTLTLMLATSRYATQHLDRINHSPGASEFLKFSASVSKRRKPRQVHATAEPPGKSSGLASSRLPCEIVSSDEPEVGRKGLTAPRPSATDFTATPVGGAPVA